MDYKDEEWKPVFGFEGYYEISNYGRLKSLQSITQIEFGVLPYRILKSSPHRDGYPRYTLCKHKKLYYHNAHRLVAIAFIPNPLNLPVVNHIDNNRLNCWVTNLEWCTYSENNLHAFKTGTKEGKRGEDNHLSILSTDQVQSIDFLLKQNTLNNKEIAAEFDIDPVTICDIKRGKTWSWLTGRKFKGPKKELTKEVIQQIFDLAIEGKIYQREIAKKFGISQTHVCEIKTGKMWPEFRKAYDDKMAQNVL